MTNKAKNSKKQKQEKVTAVPQFMRRRWLFFLISALILIPGIFSLVRFGLRPAIDFTGGSLLEIATPAATQPLSREQAQQAVGELFELQSVQAVGQQQYVLRGKEMSNQDKNQVLIALSAELGQVNELRFETVGPTLGRELLNKTMTAVMFVAGFIMIYVWRQFKDWRFGVSAILAMFHDSLILLGAFSVLGVVLGVEVDVLFVTALLTTLSFSIHDTIVVYDRIREKRANFPAASLEEIIDAAILETLSRSINNSMTIIFMLSALVVLGGETIRWFAVALLIGAITGTYSSTFTAAPLLLVWERNPLIRKLRKLKS